MEGHPADISVRASLVEFLLAYVEKKWNSFDIFIGPVLCGIAYLVCSF